MAVGFSWRWRWLLLSAFDLGWDTEQMVHMLLMRAPGFDFDLYRRVVTEHARSHYRGWAFSMRDGWRRREVQR